jgi:hypothetical protein
MQLTKKHHISFVVFALILAIFSVLFLHIRNSQAVVRTWDGGGATNNWSEDANWSSDTEPGASDVATFNGTSTKHVTIDTAINVQGIDINSGYTGVITQGAGNTVTVGTGDFDISAGTFVGSDATIDVNDAFSVTGGSFTSTTGTLSVSNAFTVSSGTFEPSTGTVLADGATATWNVATSETFYNLTFSKTSNAPVNISSGDTFVVTGTLTLTDGIVQTGTIDARGNIVVNPSYDGGSATIDFGDDGVAQTMTVNGGSVPTLRLNDPDDANDLISIAGAATFSMLNVTSGFSGAIPLNNPSDFTLVFSDWTQAAGTYDASAQSSWNLVDFNKTGGSIVMPQLVTLTGGTVSWDFDVTQTFNNVAITKNGGAQTSFATNDHAIVLGDLTLNDGQFAGINNTVDVRGDIISNSGFDGGSMTLLFGDDAVSQVYDINGGHALGIRLDDPDDANDDINLNAAAIVSGIYTTSGFSGAIPLNNPSDFVPSMRDWTQDAGTYDASAQTQWELVDFNKSGGTFIAPQITTLTLGVVSWEINGTQEFNELVVNKGSSASIQITGAETIRVLDNLTLTDGGITGGGVVEVMADVTQAATFDGGTAFIDFANNAVAQTFTINGGLTMGVRLDDANDANDDIDINAATTFNSFNIISGFSGVIPLNNPSDFTLTMSDWTQAAGTYDASAQTSWNLVDFNKTGGSITMPQLVTLTGGVANWELDVPQVFEDLTFNRGLGARISLSSDDILIVMGETVMTEGGGTDGTIQVHGDVTMASTYDGGTMILELENDAVAQTVTINTSLPHSMRFNDPADANDEIDINIAPTFSQLITTADFSGTMVLNNPSDFVVTAAALTLAGGTLDASADASWFLQSVAISTGAFLAPESITVYAALGIWDVNSTLTVNDLTVNKVGDSAEFSIATGDVIVVDGLLTLTNGQNAGNGSISALGDINQAATYDGGAGIIDFGNDALAQTYAVSGGIVPGIRFNDPDDANDDLNIAAAVTINDLITTSGFSGTVPLNNPSDFTLSFISIDSGGGTIDASTQSSWNLLDFDSTGGTFLAPILTTLYNTSTSWDINVSQEFQNLTINKSADAAQLNLSSGDTIIANGALIFINGRVDVGTVEGRGDVTIQATYDGGTAPLQFGGSANQNFNLTGATGLYNADIRVNKTGGTVALQSALVMDAVGQDLVIIEGAFDTNGNALTVNGSTAVVTVEDGGIFERFGSETLTLNGGQPTLQSGSTVRYTGDGDTAADTYTVTTMTANYHHLEIAGTDSNDTFQLGTALDLAGNLTITNGTFNVTGSNHQINIAGNWSNTGTFQEQNGTVIFDGGSQSISGTTTFNNFTKSVSAPFTLTLPASATTSFDGTLTLAGSSAVNRLSLRSSSPGVQTSIDPNSTVSATNLDVQDNNNVSGSDITCTGTCFDSGNNDGWIFPSVVVSTISGNTTEVGGTATFSLVLNTAPTDTVTVPLSSSDTTEGTIAVTEAVFTTGNWSTPQVITVTGVNDNIDDGDVAYSIVTGTVTSSDLAFNGSDPGNVSVTNIDNDTAGVIVSAVSANTTEAGGTATYTVVLTSEPATGSVRITNASTDATEGVVTGGSTLTFTNVNWNTPQTVTITGQDDGIVDGDIAYSITVTMDTGFTTDPLYDAIDPTDANLQNEDDDTPGVSVAQSGGTTQVNESGATDTYTLVLGTQPTDDVVVTISTDAEVDTDVPTVTFTDLNWSTPQTVTVNAVNDDIDESTENSTITHTSTSDDPAYDSLAIDSVVASVIDNDTAGATVSAISNNTSETGTTATFTVVLNTEPTNTVVVDSDSSDATEGVVTTGAELTFTALNWDTPQTVTVTGQDDALADGDIAYSIIITTDNTLTLDAVYDPVNPADVSVTNEDDGDAAGVVVSAISGNTTESGGTATFTVVLTAQPTGDVVIDSASNDATEGVVTSGAELTFTTVNWATPQTVTVTGQNDDLDDGNILYSILVTMDAAATQDGNYDIVEPDDVAVTNTDNDASTATSSLISNNTSEAGATATFTVVLNAEPTGDVVINAVSSDATEGVVTSGSVLTFTSLNWDTPQTVTVTGQNDVIADGNVAYTIIVTVDAASTDDPNFDGANPNDVSVINTDDGDSVGVNVSAISQNTTEAGGTATFSIVLTSEPTGNVEIDSVSGDATEGVVTVGASRTFTPANWSTPQNVTVTGQDDELDDGNVLYTILVSVDAGNTADNNYDAIDPGDVSVTNTDNDTSGAVVTAISNNTTEGGATATFTIALTAEPTNNVVIDSVSDDATEGVVTANGTITFTALNWNTPQIVTVTGQNDEVADGNVGYNIIVSIDQDDTLDNNYDAINPNDVPVINEDDGDALGVTVVEVTNTTTEAGGTATFDVVLASEPTGSVVIDSVSDDATEGVVTTGATLTFTSLNWDTPQAVVVTGQNDDIDDGDVGYDIVVTVDTTDTLDGNYDLVDPDDVAMTNTDNDTAGILVSTISGNTTEAGGTATFTVVLESEPTGDVIIDSVSDDATEGVVTTGATLTFTSLNWDTPQTVTVTGQDDGAVDGNVAYDILVTVDAADTQDAIYDVIEPDDVAVINEDDGDTAGITVSAISGNTTETGGTATFTVVLDSQPTGNVVIESISDDASEGTVTTGATLTFTALNWSTPQTVTVTGQNDDIDDGNIGFTIEVTVDTVETLDALYDVIEPDDVSVTNNDNDTAGITVSTISGNTTESGGTATFTIVLESEPVGDVVIESASDDATEGVVTTGATLTFTSLNWDTPQTVTVTGQDDSLVDGDIAYTIEVTVDAASTVDAAYDIIEPADVAVTNDDNGDAAGVSVSVISGNTSEVGGTGTFTVVLDTEPSADVQIEAVSSDPTEGVVTSGSVLTFTTLNWSTPQTVTVTGQNDAIDDGDISYSIEVSVNTTNTLDNTYDSIDPDDVSVTNTDNDTAGVTVSAISGNTTEAGGTATFTVVLTSEPTGSVEIDSVSSDATEGVVTSGSTLTFTTLNWSTPQTVMVTGQNDAGSDGNVAYTIVVTTDTTNTLDAIYDAINPSDVSVINEDDGDIVGVTVSAISGNTTEAGGSATFTVVLAAEPTNTVEVDAVSADASEGVVTSGSTLTFTPLNWSTPQTVTVTGQNDAIADGNVTYSITVSVDATNTLDDSYDPVDPNDVSVVNEDDEVAAITIDESDGTTVVVEGGATDTFTIVLEAEPTSDVTVFITGDAQVDTDVPSVTFTSLNWSTPQTVTVNAIDDGTDEANTHNGTLLFAVDSLDIAFDGYLLTSIAVAVTDNDDSDRGGSNITFVKDAEMEIEVGEDVCTDRDLVTLIIRGENIREVLIGNDEELETAMWQAIGPGLGFTQVNIPWVLPGTEGEQTVHARFRSNSGNVTIGYSATVDLGEVPESCEVEEVGDEVDEIFAHLPIMGLSPYDNVTWEPVARVFDGELIKGEHYDTVYLVENGKRRPFLDEQTYFTWFTDYKWVRLVTDATLPFYPLGEIMLPKAGAVMVKIESLPAVYVALPQNPTTLRRVTDEEQAQAIAGPAWDAFVIDVSPAVVSSYTLGRDLRSVDKLDRTKMYIRHGLQAYDQDRDGILDVEEAFFGTDPMNNDTDADGYPDGIEVMNGHDPIGYGQTEFEESDVDGDGLSNDLEERFGTDPRNADTDQDGYPDGIEVMNGFSPLVPAR